MSRATPDYPYISVLSGLARELDDLVQQIDRRLDQYIGDGEMTTDEVVEFAEIMGYLQTCRDAFTQAVQDREARKALLDRQEGSTQ